MKAAIAIAVLLLCCTVQAGNERQLLIAKASFNNYRKVDNQVYDLSFRFHYDKLEASGDAWDAGDGKGLTYLDNVTVNWVSLGAQPLPSWEVIWGTVIQICDGGVLLSKYSAFDPLMEKDSETVFVRNYKYHGVDGNKVALYVMPSKNYSYIGVTGARRTISSCDFGELSVTEEMEVRGKIKAVITERQARERQTNVVKSIKNQEAGKTAAIKFLKEKAAEGAPMAQYRLAEKYLKGDGVPLDIDQAKFWLQCSCTNGYAEASNLLQKINREQLTAKP